MFRSQNLCLFYSYRQALETNLKIEREWRTNLQEDATKDKKRIASLETELEQLDKLRKVLLYKTELMLLFSNVPIVWPNAEKNPVFIN